MAKSQKRRPVAAKDLFRLVIPSQPAISSDGNRMVFAVKSTVLDENRYVSHIHLAATRGGKVRQLTRGMHSDTWPTWSPDGKRIAFVSDRNEKPGIWVMDADGGEPEKLAELEGGPITHLSWSPAGGEILFVHRMAKKEKEEEKKKKPAYKHITRLQHKLDGMGYFRDARWHLWKVSARGGKPKQLTFGELDDTQPAWSPDGRKIAFISNRIEDPDLNLENSDIYVISSKGGTPKKITQRFGPCDSPSWSLDGRYLYYMGSFAGPGEWLKVPIHINRIPAKGGEPKDLTPYMDNWPFNFVLSDNFMGDLAPVYPFRDGDSERLAIVMNEDGACRLYSLPAKGGPLRLEMGGKINVGGLSVSASTGNAVVTVAEMMTSGDVLSLKLDGTEKSRRITRLNDRLFRSLDLTEPEERFFTNGKVKIHGWILKPPGFRKGRKYPTLLEIHGGPMCQYGFTFFHEMHLLAAQGYVVAFTNPRGSSGYGLKFMNTIHGRWGTVDYDDLMAVMRTVTRLPYVDRKHLGVLGGSYGGFMTTWMVGHCSLFTAAVTQRQAGDRLIQFGASDYGFHERHYFRGMPWEKPLAYLKASPNFYADKIKTPLLIIHSENDLRCPVAQADELFTFLRVQKKTAELIRFEGESHGLSRGGRPQNRLERMNRILDWFRRYL